MSRLSNRVKLWLGITFGVLGVILCLYWFKKQATSDALSQQRVSYLAELWFQTRNLEAKQKMYMAKLDSLQALAEEDKDERLLQYVQTTRLQYRYILALQSPQVARPYLQQAKELAEKTPYNDLKGHIYLWLGDHDKGLQLVFKAKKLLEDAGYERYSHAIYYFYSFFGLYYKFEDYNKAIYYSKKLLSKPPSNIYAPKGLYNNLGLCYLRIGEFENATKAFEQSMRAARAEGDRHTVAMAKGNIGNVLRQQGQYQAALGYLYDETRINDKVVPENAALNRVYIAQCLLKLDSIDKAREYLKPPKFRMPPWTYPFYDLARFEAWALYYSQKSNFLLANRYKDSLLALRDTLKVKLDYKKLMVLENNTQAEKYLSIQKDLQEQVQNERQWRNTIMVLLMLTFVGVLYWSNGQRFKRQQSLPQPPTAQFQSNVQGFPSTRLPEGSLAMMASLQKSVILTEADWLAFKEIFEQVFPHYFTQLQQEYPLLTAAEVRLLSLEKLHFSDKEIGNKLGISSDSVKKTRYRLRKKYPKLFETQ